MTLSSSTQCFEGLVWILTITPTNQPIEAALAQQCSAMYNDCVYQKESGGFKENDLTAEGQFKAVKIF